MISAPLGYDDMLGDAEDAPSSSSYHEIEVPGVGTLRARKPMPNAVPVLAKAATPKIDGARRADYLVLFVQNHLDEDDFDRVFRDMTMPDTDMPSDAIERIARVIATWGTARPTVPSSCSA